jgi:hypothetical protein
MPSGKKLQWTVDAYETDQGEKPAWSFMKNLEGRDQAEAIALVKLLEEKGNLLRRPQSGQLGDGLFELRGNQVRLFYMFLPGKTAVLLDGEIKKRNDIPVDVLKRMHGLRKAVERRGQAARKQEKKR